MENKKEPEAIQKDETNEEKLDAEEKEEKKVEEKKDEIQQENLENKKDSEEKVEEKKEEEKKEEEKKEEEKRVESMVWRRPLRSNCLKIEKSPPKGLMLSDFSCIFAMSVLTYMSCCRKH